MTEIKLATVQRFERNKESVDVARSVLAMVEQNPEASELIAFIRIGNEYHRRATRIGNAAELLGTLEIAKHDCLTRMQD
jgi:predicted RNA polymerase sigma factor